MILAYTILHVFLGGLQWGDVFPMVGTYSPARLPRGSSVSDLAHADVTVTLSKKCREMPGLLEAVYGQEDVIGMRINASKTKVMSALSHDE